MSAAVTLRKIGWFFLRDLAIARSYRAVLVFELVETLLGVASFYYLSEFIEGPNLQQTLPAGGYFAFVLVGFAFFDYLSVALGAFDTSLDEARRNGSLEHLLVTQTSLPVILAGSSIYPFAILSARTLVHLGWGAMFFDFSVAQANWIGALLILTASVLAFTGLGVLSAAYTLLFKRGNPVKWLFLGVAGLVSGVMYPVEVLPPFLQLVARLFPVTYSLEGMRAALLSGASAAELWPSLWVLLLFAIILLPLSLGVFSWALRRTKITGTLTHF
jgi:ABC-2 type transport system permease protein